MLAGAKSKQGSSIVESCIVIALLCLVLFGLLQVSYVVGSRNVISYASMASARAAAVGMDVDMVKTIFHFATIPTAGPVVYPPPEEFKTSSPEGRSIGEKWDYALSSANTPKSELGEFEVAMREAFHKNDYPLTVMNYENWSLGGEAEVYSNYNEDDYDEEIIALTLSQKLPLVFPFSRVFFARLPLVKVDRGGKVEEYPGKQIDATAFIENHARFYFKDVK